MLIRIATCMIMFSITIVSYADGLPFNESKTHLATRVEVLKLTPQQSREISRSMVLTLTQKQRARLQRIAKGCPQVLQVLTNRYDDCTCGASSICVWFRNGEVEVPISFLPEKPMTNAELEEMGNEIPSPIEIVLDEKSKIWVNGREFAESPFEKLLLKWQTDPKDKHRRNSAGQLSIFIDTPPILPMPQEANLKKRVDQIRSFTSKHNIDLFVSGFRTDGQ